MSDASRRLEHLSTDVEDVEDEDDSEEPYSSDSSQDLAVLTLTCHCGEILSKRGLQVSLVADPTRSLFSSDIPTDALREGSARIIQTCSCAACSVHCRRCKQPVGYHVQRPCEICSAGEHNGHFWLFDQDGVSATPRGIVWSELPYNGASDPIDGSEQPHDSEICCICAAPMWRRTRVEGCEHEFCFGCISREVDARGACPLDRRQITREMLHRVGDERTRRT